MTAPFEVSGTDSGPAPSHLTTTQQQRLRSLLFEQLEVQRAALEEHDETLDGATHDVVDAAVTSERELAAAFVLFTRDTAAELLAALARMDAGSYGRCEGCGAVIPYERLEALPETRFCVSCPRHGGLFG
jgi:RNA polymerase-binding transcription factor DksA